MKVYYKKNSVLKLLVLTMLFTLNLFGSDLVLKNTVTANGTVTQNTDSFSFRNFSFDSPNVYVKDSTTATIEIQAGKYNISNISYQPPSFYSDEPKCTITPYTNGVAGTPIVVNVKAGSSTDLSKNTNFQNITKITIHDEGGNAQGCKSVNFDTIVYTIPPSAKQDTDSTLTPASGVDESQMIAIPTTATTLADKVDVLDFTITDLGSGDGLPTSVKEIKVNVGGTATSGSKLLWWLSRKDKPNANPTRGRLFKNQVLFRFDDNNITDDSNATYTLSVFWRGQPTGLVDNATFDLSVSATTASTGSQLATLGAKQKPVSNNNNAKVDVTATKLVFARVPSNDAFTTITAPTLNTKTASSITVNTGTFTDSDGERNVTVKLYSDARLTSLAGTNVDGNFTGLTSSTTYYAVTSGEAKNATNGAWEVKVSSASEVTTISIPTISWTHQSVTNYGLPIDLPAPTVTNVYPGAVYSIIDSGLGDKTTVNSTTGIITQSWPDTTQLYSTSVTLRVTNVDGGYAEIQASTTITGVNYNPHNSEI